MMNLNCSRYGGLLASAALTLATSNSGWAVLYSVKDLGALVNLSGRTDSMAYGINNLGQVVAANVTGGAYRAMIYSGAWTNLGTLGVAPHLPQQGGGASLILLSPQRNSRATQASRVRAELVAARNSGGCNRNVNQNGPFGKRQSRLKGGFSFGDMTSFGQSAACLARSSSLA
jgi:probable HAF family extracellular repeat protein